MEKLPGSDVGNRKTSDSNGSRPGFTTGTTSLDMKLAK